MSYNWQTPINAGNPNVTYDDSGRPLVDHQPRNLLHWRDTGIVQDPPPPPTASRWSFLPWNFGTTERPSPKPAVDRTPALVLARHDYTSPQLQYVKDYRDQDRPVRFYHSGAQRLIYPSSTTMEATVIDEMKVYNDWPILFWLFIVEGVCLFVLGVLARLWCLSWDQMYYARFWTGILLVLFGLAGAIHRGDYYKRMWKSWLFIILAVVTAVAVMVCTSFTLDVFCHQLIEVAQFASWNDYIQEMLFRIQNIPDYPLTNLTSPPDWPSTNVMTCFTMDGIQVLLLMIAFFTVTSLLLVIDRFYNSHYIITRMVEPFCEPRIFNPFGQVSMGQAQIFVGFVLQASVHGADVFLWQQTYAPVWAGILPCVAGVFTALSLKSCGLQHRIWNFISLLLEILTIIVCVVAIVLVTIGMIQNLQTLGDTPVMTYTTFAQRMIVASVFLFCISDIFCVVSIFYAIALLVRLVICICCTKAEDQIPLVTYVEEDENSQEPLRIFPPDRQYRFLENNSREALLGNLKKMDSFAT